MKLPNNFFAASLFQTLITFIAPVVCVGSVVSLQQAQLTAMEQKNTGDYTKQEQSKKIYLDTLKQTPTFGFSNLVGSLIFLDFIQYFGDASARDQTGYTLSTDYFAAVVEHNPRFVEAYLYLAPATSLFAGKPETTVSLMKEGLKSLSPKIDKSYMIWTFKGVDELLFLGDIKAAQNSYKTAAQWAKVQNDKTSQTIGNRARETAVFLATNPDSKNARASSWMMIYSNARDEQTRQTALSNIEKLGGKVIATPNQITVKMPNDNKG